MPFAVQGSVGRLASDASHRWSYPSAGRASYIPCKISRTRRCRRHHRYQQCAMMAMFLDSLTPMLPASGSFSVHHLPACPIPTAYRVGSAADGIQCSEQTHPSAAPPFNTGFHFSACRVRASRRIWNWAKAWNGVQNVRWFVDGSDFWVSAPSLQNSPPKVFRLRGIFISGVLYAVRFL